MINTSFDPARAAIALAKAGVTELGIKLFKEVCPPDNYQNPQYTFPRDYLDWAREIIYYSKTCEHYPKNGSCGPENGASTRNHFGF